MADLYPTINQLTYWGIGDYNECSIIAAYWAARAAGFTGTLPTIAAFKQAAGVTGQVMGHSAAEIGSGLVGTSLAVMKPLVMQGAAWTDFVAAMKAGGTASLSVDSALLPSELRFGFYGTHSIGVVYAAGQWYVANPLAPDKSAPLPISEAALKVAAAAFGGGGVVGIFFKAQTTSIAPPATRALPPNLEPPSIGSPAPTTHYEDAALTLKFYLAKHPHIGEGKVTM